MYRMSIRSDALIQPYLFLVIGKRIPQTGVSAIRAKRAVRVAPRARATAGERFAATEIRVPANPKAIPETHRRARAFIRSKTPWISGRIPASRPGRLCSCPPAAGPAAGCQSVRPHAVVRAPCLLARSIRPKNLTSLGFRGRNSSQPRATRPSPARTQPLVQILWNEHIFLTRSRHPPGPLSLHRQRNSSRTDAAG